MVAPKETPLAPAEKRLIPGARVLLRGVAAVGRRGSSCSSHGSPGCVLLPCPSACCRVHRPAPGAAGTGPIAGTLGAWLRHSWHWHGAISSVSSGEAAPSASIVKPLFKKQPLCSWNCGWLPATGPCFDFKDVGFAPFRHKVQTGTAWLRQNKFCPGIKGGQLFLRLLPAAALPAARCLRPGSANR